MVVADELAIESRDVGPGRLGSWGANSYSLAQQAAVQDRRMGGDGFFVPGGQKESAACAAGEFYPSPAPLLGDVVVGIAVGSPLPAFGIDAGRSD